MNEDIHEQILDQFENRRFGQAQYELRRLVEADEDDAPTRSLLALCLTELEHFDEALAQARHAADDAPEEPFCVWTLGSVLVARQRFTEALPHALNAVQLAPEDADHWALCAQCHVGLGQWREALAATDHGLQRDEDHIGLSNLRALALLHTDRSSEADQAYIDASALSTDNAFARAGRGWAALQAGRSPDTAMAHFYRALQIDPHSDWAKTGLLAALKARNPVYRLMLRYFLWSGSLTPRTRLFIMFGGIVAFGRLRALARAEPELVPVIYPLLGAWLLFVLLSWTADPLFDFLLRLDKEGRTLIDAERRLASSLVVGTIAAAIATGVTGFALDVESLQLLALVLVFLVIPLAGTFQCEPGWPRTTMAAFVLVIALCGIAGVIVPDPLSGTLLVICLLGAVIGSWLARFLASRVPAR